MDIYQVVAFLAPSVRLPPRGPARQAFWASRPDLHEAASERFALLAALGLEASPRSNRELVQDLIDKVGRDWTNLKIRDSLVP